MYGEAEFWFWSVHPVLHKLGSLLIVLFSSIKVITITGMIILGIVLDLGGGPNHDRVGFRYWRDPGPFVNFDSIQGVKGHFLGWARVVPQATFSYVGAEVVAVCLDIPSVIYFLWCL